MSIFCDFHIKLDMDDSSDEFFPTFVPLLSISQQDSSKRFHIHLEGGDLEIDIVCKRIVSFSEDFWSKNKL
ncbi:hypothetical protein BMY_2119 [Wohlfahrtiimonas chitiniclastica]|nr:hypothetical protein BMY_2119 [Wohlfahrtiimonas chitiniclastica]